MEWRLLASAGSSFLIAGIYAYVGLRLVRRPAAGDARRASQRFGVFWLGLGAHTALAGALTAAFLVGGPAPLLVAAAAFMACVVIAAMFWGLMSYLLFLYTGKRIVFRLTTLAYVAQLVPLLLAVAILRPVGAYMEGWIPMIAYANPAGSALDGIASLTFIIPPLIASWMYLSLFRRVEDAAARWRIGLVGGSIGLWFLLAVVGRFLDLLPGDTGAVIGRAIAISAALIVLAAYEPPAWAQRRYGARRLGHEVTAPPADPARAAARREALVARTRELV
jgi:hypothetical protein